MAATRKPAHRQDDRGAEVVEKPRSRKRPQRPRLYTVLLHNDDYTPMEFVVAVLREIFRKSELEATSIMLHAHTRGQAVAGVFTREVAETKVDETAKRAAAAGYPLLATLEPEEGGEREA